MMADSLLELEFAIIGGLIHQGSKAGAHISELRPEDFSEPVTRSIFSAVRTLFFQGAPIDRISLMRVLGDDYAEAIDASLNRATSELPYYIELLQNAGKLKKVKDYGLALSYAESFDAVAPALDGLNALMVQQRDRKAVGLEEALHRFFERQSRETPNYLKWGFPELDEKLFCEAGDFVVIGGYPSAGKTMLAVQFALGFAKAGKRVGFFSLETCADKLTDRLVSHTAQVPLERIKKHQLAEADVKACTEAAENLHSLCLDEIPAAGMTAADIHTYSLAQRYDTIFIDYLQLVKDNSRCSRFDQVTNISQALHSMSQSSGITVIALAQLSRPDKTLKRPTPPTMSSFRESGQIEQDADIALLLYQEDPNNYKGRRVLKIGKNKEGERAKMLLDFNGECQTLSPAKPTKAESYAAVVKASKDAMRTRAAESVNIQVSFEDLTEDEGGDLPF